MYIELLDFIILYLRNASLSSLNLEPLLEVSRGVQGKFFTLYLFLNKERIIKMCQKCHYMSIHGYQNFFHVRDICQVRDNITLSVSSKFHMHDRRFLLYLKSTACQYLLSNTKSVFKAHPYMT